MTLLYTAAFNGRTEVVQLLVEKGADIHFKKGGEFSVSIKYNNIKEIGAI